MINFPQIAVSRRAGTRVAADPRQEKIGHGRAEKLFRARLGASREPPGLHELLRAHRRVASEVGLGFLGPAGVVSTGRAAYVLWAVRPSLP
jgi:hypothetical protein